MVFTELLSSLWTQLVVVFRPMLKWFLHKVTGKCELLRITYEEKPGVKQIKRIEKSLKGSRTGSLKALAHADDYNVDAAVKDIVRLKGIVIDVHSHFEDALKRCLLYISSYNHMIMEVESLQKVRYSSHDAEHEAKLLKLWTLLKPDTELQSRTGEHWTELGFQGHDPMTDFRGMGILGLDQLIYFAEKYNNEARKAWLKACHPKQGFSFAIVGINITELQYRLLVKRRLRTHFYNLQNRSSQLATYHEVYCFLLSDFTNFWFSEKPRDIMEFSRIRDKFYRKITTQLKDPNCVLVADFQQ